MKQRQNKYGEWAFVTGASSGIGKSFCELLAKQKYNLILVARSKDKLESLANVLEKQYAIRTIVKISDLSNLHDIETIEELFKQYNIGLLVNNAGWGQPGVFAKHDLDNCIRETQLNINTPLTLTKWFIDHSKSARKAVIFVSSIAAYMGSPFLGNYAATKAWTLNFGIALHHELKQHLVDVLVLAPGPTKTGMFGIESVDFSKMPMHWMRPEKVAQIALNNLGKKAIVVPGGLNKVMSFMMGKVMPRSFAQKMFGSMMKPAMPKEIL